MPNPQLNDVLGGGNHFLPLAVKTKVAMGLDGGMFAYRRTRSKTLMYQALSGFKAGKVFRCENELAYDDGANFFAVDIIFD